MLGVLLAVTAILLLFMIYGYFKNSEKRKELSEREDYINEQFEVLDQKEAKLVEDAETIIKAKTCEDENELISTLKNSIENSDEKREKLENELKSCREGNSVLKQRNEEFNDANKKLYNYTVKLHNDNVELHNANKRLKKHNNYPKNRSRNVSGIRRIKSSKGKIVEEKIVEGEMVEGEIVEGKKRLMKERLMKERKIVERKKDEGREKTINTLTEPIPPGNLGPAFEGASETGTGIPSGRTPVRVSEDPDQTL